MTRNIFRARATIAIIFVTAVLDIVAMGIVIPVLLALIEQFAGPNARAGVINGLFVALWALMQFIASPVIGSLSDQYGRRPVILLSAAGLAADYVLMALAPNLWWLAAGRIIAGITSASFTTVYAYMADITPPEKRMRFSWSRANPLGALRLLRSHHELFGLTIVNLLLYFAHHVFSTVSVLYAAYRYGWSAWEVGVLLALVGVLDMIVQGTMVGPFTRRFGDRATMIFGLFGGAAGVAMMGLAPNGFMFTLAMFPNALWGLAMPTLQSLMTQRVSESEQGQLQGPNMSVASVAGIASPLFFGAVYSFSIDEAAGRQYPGAAFLIAGAVLFVAALIGWRVARRVEGEIRTTRPLPQADRTG